MGKCIDDTSQGFVSQGMSLHQVVLVIVQMSVPMPMHGSCPSVGLQWESASVASIFEIIVLDEVVVVTLFGGEEHYNKN